MKLKCIWCEEVPIKVKKVLLCRFCYAKYRLYGTPTDKRITKKWCVVCSEAPAVNKKRSLCKRCYNKFLYANRLSGNRFSFKKPEHLKRRHHIKGLVKRYGVQILKDLKRLKVDWNWTLHDVGVKHGVTREYIRQSYKKVFGGPYTKASKAKQGKWQQKKATTSDLVCKNNPLHKIATHKNSSKTKQGALIEKLFMDNCKSRGINCDIPCDSLNDFKINGFNIEVKSRNTKLNAIQFLIRTPQYHKADFFACYHSEEKTFFIIPKEKVSVTNRNSGKSYSITIRKALSNHPLAKNLYWEYKDAWHLLGSDLKEP